MKNPILPKHFRFGISQVVLLFILIMSLPGWAQWNPVNDASGGIFYNGQTAQTRVAIGTSTNIPLQGSGARVTINGKAGYWHLRLINTEEVGGKDWLVGTSSNEWGVGAGKFIICDDILNSGNSSLVINAAHYVGLSIPDPKSRLHVNGDIRGSGIYLGLADTETPPAAYKLAVNGKAVVEEVVVKLKATWPDYVFADTYKLPSLLEVERYIRENKHLPEVPSAQAVKDEGLSLGEMNAVLLKKVEELTLYMIEMKKEMEILKSAVQKQEAATTEGR